MPLWKCDFEGCRRSSVRTQGDCVLCNRHLCSEHLDIDFHACPGWEDSYDHLAWEAEEHELTRLIQKIDTKALETRASSLRQGIPCTIPPLRYDRDKRSTFMGGRNYHIEIHFNDDVVWIARVRRFNAMSPPDELRDYIIRSEVATLQFLEKTSVPAPRLHDFALESSPDNDVGVGFILTDKMPGKPLRWNGANEEERRKVMDQLADVFVELHRHPFDSLGSLDSPGGSQVGGFAREALIDLEYHHNNNGLGGQPKMQHTGPFSSLEDYYMSQLRLILDLIVRDEMYSEQSVDAYLIHRHLIDLVPRVLPPTGDGKFYLKHADDKGDHILVDDDYNITGIIDWEWAHTASPAHAFNTPMGFLPVADFYGGVNDLGHDEATFARLLEEKGRKDLADFVWKGRLQHRFSFCCGYSFADWNGFLRLFGSLRKAVGVDEGLEWDEWRVTALERYKGDDGLELLLNRCREVSV